MRGRSSRRLLHVLGRNRRAETRRRDVVTTALGEGPVLAVFYTQVRPSYGMSPRSPRMGRCILRRCTCIFLPTERLQFLRSLVPPGGANLVSSSRQLVVSPREQQALYSSAPRQAIGGSPYASRTSATSAAQSEVSQEDYGLFGSQQQCAPSLCLSLFRLTNLVSLGSFPTRS